MSAPHDPFGNNPFGAQPFGNPAPGAAPVFGAAAPAPSGRTTNVLATLSVVFAVIFAPAGAVLGHLGLAQVRRTGQPGRQRALIGVVASYAVISLVVIAVTAWVILRPNASTSPGGSHPAIAASPVAVTDLGKLLPSLDQLKKIMVQNDVRQVATSTELKGASVTTVPPDCRGAFSIADPHVYQPADVAGVYRIDYRGTLSEEEHTTDDYDVQIAVVAFADPDHAAAAVRATASVLQVCAGERIRLTDSTGNTDMYYSRVAGEPVNVTTVENTPSAGKKVVSRALAAKANVAIDLYFRGPQMTYTHLADIANAIQGNIPS
jgi:eukaryotic-like serine/threonine-protein kinase